MSNDAYRSTLKLSATVFLISIFHVVAPNIVAADLQNREDNKVATARVPPPNTNIPAEDSGTPMPIATRLNSTESHEQSGGSTSQQPATSQPATPAPNAVAPLTPRQKFKYFARSSFMP